MSTVTYYFNSYDTGEEWNETPGNMIDGDTATRSSTHVANDIQLCDGNTCAGTELGLISKIELRAFVSYLNTSANDIYLRPVFSGGDGDNHTVDANVARPGSWKSYVDITTDTNAPSSWTWANVQNLNCDVEMIRNSAPFGLRVDVYKIEIQVTYTEYGLSPYTDSIGDALSPYTDSPGDALSPAG